MNNAPPGVMTWCPFQKSNFTGNAEQKLKLWFELDHETIAIFTL